MSVIKSEDNKKWINAFVAVISILAGYVVIRFAGQMGEWFDLEAKVGNFLALSQGLGIVLGIACFLGAINNKKAMTHLNEVYSELTKAVWPDKDSVVKITVGLVVSLSIISIIFVAIDLAFRFLLKLIY